MHARRKKRRTRQDRAQRGLFEAPAARATARGGAQGRLEAALKDGSMSAEYQRQRIRDVLYGRQVAGATEQELLNVIRIEPRLLAARLQELVADGEIVHERTVLFGTKHSGPWRYVLKGWDE
jgi:hypothetical protein